MPSRRRAIAVVSTCAVALAASAATESAKTPEARWSAVVACASRADERLRHACVDDVLRSAGVLTTEQEQREQRQRFGRATTAPPAPSSEASSLEPEPDAMELEIASVAESRDGRLTFNTRDGAVWRQTENHVFALTPASGQILTVRRAALGSFLCQVNSRSAFRCSRSR